MMTHKLKFNSNKTLVKLARDTITASKFKVAYQDKLTADKCFLIVKDEGIYLMNCYHRDNSSAEFSRDSSVVYASGFNPKHNEDVWEDSHAISGDDFAENIYLTDEQLERVANGGSIDISLTEDSIGIRA